MRLPTNSAISRNFGYSTATRLITRNTGAFVGCPLVAEFIVLKRVSIYPLR